MTIETKRVSEKGRIHDQLKRRFSGRAWHGPAGMELLADVSAGNQLCDQSTAY